MSADNTRQIEKFKEAARKAEADESDDALDRVMSKLDLRKKPDPVPPTEKK